MHHTSSTSAMMLPAPLPVHSIQQQAQNRIFALVDIKTRFLRASQNVLVEENFLEFLNNVEQFEDFVRETVSCPWTTINTCAKKALQQLSENRKELLRKFGQQEKQLDEVEDDKELLSLFAEKVDK